MMSSKEKKDKTLKIIATIGGVLLLVAGLVILGYGIIKYFGALMHNSNLESGQQAIETSILPFIISSPLLFGGFFLIVLGVGKKKTKL